MDKKTLVIIIILLVVGAAAVGIVYYYNNLRGVWPSISSPPQDITTLINASTPITTNTNSGSAEKTIPESVNNTDVPLTVPSGFSISILSGDLEGARVLEQDYDGNLWVSQSALGQITKLTLKDGVEIARTVVFSKLTNPHGLAFHPHNTSLLYFAESNKISRVDITDPTSVEKIVDLPAGGGHNKRTIAFGPDGLLYVGIGSTCNVCLESDSRNATVYSMHDDGSDFKVLATGLRNASFLRFHASGELWATGNQRDLIGDDIPPDEINIIQEGKFYGWPFCYGQNILDTAFDASASAQEKCNNATPPHIEIQAHSAPLGLDFVPSTSRWPTEYADDLIVALHGSWNRTIPTGYKLIRMQLGPDGTYTQTTDFISGWLTDDGALGRPVDVLINDAGVMFVSDDKASVIYRITYGD